MNKFIIFSIFLAFTSISAYSSGNGSTGSKVTPGKSKNVSKENKNKKKQRVMHLRLPSGQLKKDFQVF
jgi:hypothetical protein